MTQNHADWSVKLVEAELKLPVTAALALTLPAERSAGIPNVGRLSVDKLVM